jgi:hypothetical protein
MRKLTRPRRFTLIMIFAMAFCTCAQAANLKVNCNSKGALSTINGALKQLHPEESNTITVSGICSENVLIQSFDRLVLIAETGATINDATGGLAGSVVIDIEDSRRVTVQGFAVNGGDFGVICNNGSFCYLTGNTVQAALSGGVLVSTGSHAFLASNVLQNNVGRGLTVNHGSVASSTSDIFRGNADGGVVANSGAYFVASTSMIQNNGSDGSSGITVGNHSSVRLISCSVTGNTADGVSLRSSSEAEFDAFSGPSTVTGNGGSGVSLRDLSFATLLPGNNITGNLGGTDVLCNPQFSATRGALTNIGGGTTNCVEP